MHMLYTVCSVLCWIFREACRWAQLRGCNRGGSRRPPLLSRRVEPQRQPTTARPPGHMSERSLLAGPRPARLRSRLPCCPRHPQAQQPYSAYTAPPACVPLCVGRGRLLHQPASGMLPAGLVEGTPKIPLF